MHSQNNFSYSRKNKRRHQNLICVKSLLDTMRVVRVIFLVFFIKFTKSNKNSEVIGIIEEIINSNNARHVSYVNLLTTENYVRNSSINDFLNELMWRLSKFKFVISMDEKVIAKLYKKRILMTVIFTHSLDDFIKLTAKFTYFHFHYGGFYVVLFENAENHEVSKIFKISWDLYIYNINLIRYINNSIVVETFFPFTSTYCNKTTPVQVAKYDNEHFELKPEDYFPKKFKNFYNCTINIASVTALSPSILKREFSNGSFELYGRDIEMLKTLSKELNFYANNTYLHPYGSWGQMFPNKTMSGAMGMAQRRSVDFAFGNLNLKVDRTEIMDYSHGYTLETLVFMIPKGRPMSPFHKLLRPFDNFVWISIFIVMLISMIVIAFLSLMPRKLRRFVYGDRVTTPFMNLLIAMYGGAQTILPKYNFARSLLMMFLLFCLVLRSLYQGALFQYLQASDNEPEVQSIEEMAARGFTFFTIPSYDDMLKNNSLTRNRRAVIPATDMKEVMDQTLNPYYAGCVMNSITEILYRNKLKARSREPLYTICKVIVAQKTLSEQLY